MNNDIIAIAREASRYADIEFQRTWESGEGCSWQEFRDERFAALARADEPVLQDIEQYRLQMAAICTAAIGYWKEGDGIHPDYDTSALQDVAKLYAKYDALYKAQPVPHAVIAGALFDFMGWLTSRPKRIMLSSVDDATPAVDAIRDFAKMRGLSLDDARVTDWQDALAQPEQEPVDLSYQPDWKEEYQKAVDLHCLTLDELREANFEIKRLKAMIESQDMVLVRSAARIVDLQTHIENLEGEDR